jgi:pimeloyl-ACP methyl ester carboxylesterase
MFMNPKSWANWLGFFSQKGHRCHAVAWPHHEGEPAELRRAPPAGLGKLSLGEVLERVRTFIGTLSAPPILIGHSMGGLVVQKMVNEGRAAGGVCIDSAPPKGVFVPKWSFLKVNLPVVNPLAGDSAFQFTVDQFHYAFCNTMTRDEAQKAFDAFVVPESRNVPRSGAGADGALDFKKPHAPLAGSKRELKVMPGRTHFLCGQPGWEELATLVHDWLGRVAA